VRSTPEKVPVGDGFHGGRRAGKLPSLTSTQSEDSKAALHSGLRNSRGARVARIRCGAAVASRDVIESTRHSRTIERLFWSALLLLAHAGVVGIVLKVIVDLDWQSGEALWLLYLLLPFSVVSATPLFASMRRALLAWLAAVGGYLLFALLAIADPDPIGIGLMIVFAPIIVTLFVIAALALSDEE
jgi:hypothetical protein